MKIRKRLFFKKCFRSPKGHFLHLLKHKFHFQKKREKRQKICWKSLSVFTPEVSVVLTGSSAKISQIFKISWNSIQKYINSLQQKGLFLETKSLKRKTNFSIVKVSIHSCIHRKFEEQKNIKLSKLFQF